GFFRMRGSPYSRRVYAPLSYVERAVASALRGHCSSRVWDRGPPLVPRPIHRATEDDRVVLVELAPSLVGQVIPLSLPCDGVGEGADAHGQRERARQTAPPRLEVGVAQPRKPRARGRQSVHLLEEPECNEEGREGVRDRGITPVDHAQSIALAVEVGQVEVVVLDRRRDAVRGQLGAELREARNEPLEPIPPGLVQWEVR